MRKVLCILISATILICSSIIRLPVYAEKALMDYVVPVVSDISGVMHIIGKSNNEMLKKGNILVPIEDACKIADASIVLKDKKGIIISRNTVSWCCDYSDKEKQFLIVDLMTGDGDFYQSINNQIYEKTSFFDFSSDTKIFKFNPYEKADCFFKREVDYSEKTNIPYQSIDNQLYVSFYPFLEMMGVKIDIIDENIIKEIVDGINNVISLFDNKDYITYEDLRNFFIDEFGFDTLISCNLGLPIDKLYKDYYNNDYMFDIGDYYSQGNIAIANIANSIAQFDGITKTILSALDIDFKFDDSITEVITQKGNRNQTNNNEELYDMYQEQILNINAVVVTQEFLSENAKKMIKTCKNDDSILRSKIFNHSERTKNFSSANNVIEPCLSACLEYMKAYSTVDKLNKLFEDDREILNKTVLSSDNLYQNIKSEFEPKDIILQGGLYKASKIENSYLNFYRSAEHVQEYMSNPELTQITDALLEATYSVSDNVITSMIDATFFGGVPVTDLACTLLQCCTSDLKKYECFKVAANIANIDDYIFIQSIAQDCFKENGFKSDEEYFSFTLGIKASLTAYIAQESNSTKQRDLEYMLSAAVSANRNFYRTDYSDVPDLSGFLINNTNLDIEKGITATEDITTTNIIENNYADVSGKWKELYEKQIKEMPDSTNNNGLPQDEFLLYDMNNDNVPELICIEYLGLGNSVDIYTIYNDEIVSVGKFPGYIFYNKEENIIINGYNMDGSGNVTYIGYILEGGDLKQKFKLFYDDYDYDTWTKKLIYQYNDEDISEQQYNELKDKFIPSNLICISDSYDIKHYITNEIGIKLAFYPEEKVIGKVITEVDDLNVRNEPNTSSNIIGKLPKNSEVEIVATRFDWYQIDVNGRVGFVSMDYISLIDREVKTSINPYIEVFTAAPWGNGLTYILHMNGDYSYYNYEHYYDCGEGIICQSGTYDKATLNLGTVSPGLRYCKVAITPYNEVGEVGETVTIEADNTKLTNMPKVEAIDKKGTINASKDFVSGYDDTYVIYNGQPNEKTRESLGDGWHVTAVAKCESRGITWYKLYDTDDNDYYGWVDSKYIDFS